MCSKILLTLTDKVKNIKIDSNIRFEVYCFQFFMVERQKTSRLHQNKENGALKIEYSIVPGLKENKR